MLRHVPRLGETHRAVRLDPAGPVVEGLPLVAIVAAAQDIRLREEDLQPEEETGPEAPESGGDGGGERGSRG